MTGRMRISPAGIELIKSFEGFREIAVRLPDGRWTIGYGHVRTAREGLTITPKDAEELLKHDLVPVEHALASLIYAPLMQGQFDALASLTYNISVAQFRESDILAQLNAGNYLAAANGFDLWRKAKLHGRVMIVDALVRRRAAEKALFLDHPSGFPSAPTPIVTPQIDTAEEPSRVRAPAEAVNDDDVYGGAGPRASGEIAEAVRRLAERTQGAILPPAEIALAPGATLVPPPPPAAPVVEEPAAVESPAAEPVAEPAEREVEAAPEVTAEGLARASRTMAERVSRILSGVEQKIEKHEAVPVEAPKAAEKPVAIKPAKPDVREGLPDFDQPAERVTHAAANRLRDLIDDMEVVEPGKDPASLFAEAERKAKIVNGHARRVGPVSGRLLVQMPWIVVLVLSLLGFVIGAVDTFKDAGAETGGPRVAGTILAVFGVMTLMSLYYLFLKRASDES